MTKEQWTFAAALTVLGLTMAQAAVYGRPARPLPVMTDPSERPSDRIVEEVPIALPMLPEPPKGPAGRDIFRRGGSGASLPRRRCPCRLAVLALALGAASTAGWHGLADAGLEGG